MESKQAFKILILKQKADDGCTWYRLTQFADMANKLKIANVQFIDMGLPEDELYEILKQADIYLGRLDAGLGNVLFELNLAGLKKPLVIDIDDSMDDIDPLSSMYEALGVHEVKLDNGQYLWEDGKAGFDIKRNKLRIEQRRKILKRATAVIVTTLELKNYAEQYNKNVAIVPNAINLEIFPLLKIDRGDQTGIMWSGGATHFSDLMDIKDGLTEVMRQPNIHFYYLGNTFGGLTKDMDQSRVHTYGWIKPDGHGWRLACMGAQIGICPLLDTPFNRNKSSVKYYEYSALKLATLAKNIPPYSDDIVDGYNGLLYDTPLEFTQKLKTLIDDPILRMQLAENAYTYVKENRNLVDITKEWVDLLRGIAEAYTLYPPKENPHDFIRVTRHKEFTIEPIKGKDATSTMKTGCEVLKQVGIKHWITSGNLLGIYRDKKLIDHDTDIDVCAVLDYKNVNYDQLRELTIQMQSCGLSVVLDTSYKDVPMQLAFIDQNNVIFDIYFYYENLEDDPNIVVNYNMEGVIRKPKKFIETLKTLTWEGTKYNIPNHIKEFLVWRFGSDWQTPKKSKQPWQTEATHIQLWSE